MPWDYELPGRCNAGVLACECTGESRPVFMLAARRRRNSQPGRLRYEVYGEPPSVVSHALGP